MPLRSRSARRSPSLDLLNRSAYAHNTVVIFTSDHGEYGGSQGLRFQY
ncbi:MAG: hypothetical protein WCD18_17295 [Thermosynechococcaceae cyanobacterium]